MAKVSQGSNALGGSPPIPRRRSVELLLGSGFFATAVAFIYPVLRYLVPPKTSDLGSDVVMADLVWALRSKSAKKFPLRSRRGPLIRTNDSEYDTMSARC